MNNTFWKFHHQVKKKIKKLCISCLLSIICGSICGKLVYEIYDKKLDNDLYGEKIYLIQAGSYSDYDNMVKNTTLNSYIYYKDEDGLFKSIIGLTEDKNNIEKIKNTYGKEVSVNEYYSKDIELNQKIKEYNKKISTTDKKEDIQSLVLEILNLYKDNTKTLTQVTS